jgi:host factor-I protein
METKSQNIQDVYLNTVRREKTPVTIFLMSGVKLMGRLRGFDKYSVILESNHQDQLIFKHAISTVTTSRPGGPPRREQPRESRKPEQTEE